MDAVGLQMNISPFPRQKTNPDKTIPSQNMTIDPSISKNHPQQHPFDQDSESDACAPLLEISESLLPAPLPRESTVESLSFSSLLNPPLKLQTNEAQCGGKLWPAGMVLAEHLSRNHLDDLRGKTMFVRSLRPRFMPHPPFPVEHAMSFAFAGDDTL